MREPIIQVQPSYGKHVRGVYESDGTKRIHCMNAHCQLTSSAWLGLSFESDRTTEYKVISADTIGLQTTIQISKELSLAIA